MLPRTVPARGPAVAWHGRKAFPALISSNAGGTYHRLHFTSEETDSKRSQVTEVPGSIHKCLPSSICSQYQRPGMGYTVTGALGRDFPGCVCLSA